MHFFHVFKKYKRKIFWGKPILDPNVEADIRGRANRDKESEINNQIDQLNKEYQRVINRNTEELEETLANFRKSQTNQLNEKVKDVLERAKDDARQKREEAEEAYKTIAEKYELDTQFEEYMSEAQSTTEKAFHEADNILMNTSDKVEEQYRRFNEEADTIMKEARKECNKIITDANTSAAKEESQAQNEAAKKRIDAKAVNSEKCAEAENKYQQIIEEAHLEANKMIAKAEENYENTRKEAATVLEHFQNNQEKSKADSEALRLKREQEILAEPTVTVVCPEMPNPTFDGAQYAFLNDDKSGDAAAGGDPYSALYDQVKADFKTRKNEALRMEFQDKLLEAMKSSHKVVKELVQYSKTVIDYQIQDMVKAALKCIEEYANKQKRPLSRIQEDVDKIKSKVDKLVK